MYCIAVNISIVNFQLFCQYLVVKAVSIEKMHHIGMVKGLDHTRTYFLHSLTKINYINPIFNSNILGIIKWVYVKEGVLTFEQR